MATDKRKQKPVPALAPATKRGPVPAADSPIEEMGAEDESASDARQSREKTNRSRKRPAPRH